MTVTGSDESPETADFATLLDAAFPPRELPPEVRGVRARSRTAAQLAQLEIVVKTQYAIYVGFQALVFALTAAATVALMISIWRLMTGDATTAQTVQNVVAALGGLLIGSAAVFIQKQAATAKANYATALRQWKQG
ncbi:hypothetical protein [Nocardia lasii]|uniref:Phage holin family protein n=1 Tax=Nocardia lasii TaxID=1616107 RepID=A0ABW1JLZ8_9NOCA